MSNQLYDKGRNAFLVGEIDWESDTIKAMLVRTTGGGGTPYSPDLVNDQFLDDVPDNTYARAADPEEITSCSATNGVADGDDVLFAAVAGGDAIQRVLIFKDTGDEATSPLIALLDTITGFPFTPSGADANIVWSNGSNKIFKL